LAPLIVVVIAPLILVAPWRASVGNYGTLVALPNQETIIRAPESATLIALRAQPGEQVARGAVIGRMGNLDVEDQAAQVASELARVNAEYDRLLGEMRTKGESAARADLLLQQRQIEYRELNDERRQIAGRRRSEMISRTPIISPISFSSDPGLSSDLSAADLPPALAVLQSEIDLRRAQSGEANAQLSRARKLFADGLLPRSELDAVETRASTLAIGLAGARDQLNAALIEHRRKHANAATEVNVANSDLGSERLQIEKLGGELHAIRTIIASLEARRELLRRKQAQFELVSSQAGAVFGEELPRMMGQYFQKGSEICRVVDTRRLLVRIQVPEREIGDVSLGRQVRLKARSFPDRVFLGVVTKIGGESEQDQNNQATYRVELTIENVDGLLRPGMTAFARIDFDRQMIGRILLHKIKQSLRPEMWML
jgi:multidrug resistance efflux pump